MLSRGRSSDAQPALSAVSVSPPMLAIHRSQAPVASSSSQTPQACASASSTSRLMNIAEEAAQVGMRDQQIERELHGVALDRRHALGALAVVAQCCAAQPAARAISPRRRLVARRDRLAATSAGCRHGSIMRAVAAPAATLPSGRLAVSSFWPMPAWPARAMPPCCIRMTPSHRAICRIVKAALPGACC